LPYEVNCKVHEILGIPRMDLDTEETRETHNLYIERTRGNLKNIIQYLRFMTSEKEIRPYIHYEDEFLTWCIKCLIQAAEQLTGKLRKN